MAYDIAGIMQGIGDTYKKSRGNYLSKMAFGSNGETRQTALAELAGINPQAALETKKTLEDQDYESLIKASKLLVSLEGNEDLANQAYQRMKPQFTALGLNLPEQLDPTVWQSAKQIAGAGGQAKARSSHILEDGTIAFMDEYGNLTRTKERASNSYGFQTDAQGNVFAQDKRGGTVAPAPMGSVQAPMPQVPQGADPMAGGLERINQTVQVLKDNNVPVAQINAWADAEFAKLQQGVRGGVIQQPQQARVAVKPDAPKGRSRVMTPQEVANAGLPQGTSAQVNEDTGSISVLNKPAPVSPKQANADVVKQAAQLPSLIRRVERVAQASENMGLFGADGGPIDQYALRFSEGGQELESAVGQLRSMLLPFVRVPGVGAQSDLEARLDGLQYPDASQPPAVRARNIVELQKFIADLSRVYTSAIRGGDSQQPNANSQPVQIRNADEYNRLPSGARYIDPSGKPRVKK